MDRLTNGVSTNGANGHAPGQMVVNAEQWNELKRLVENHAFLTRDALSKALFDPRRNLNRECGYSDNPSDEEYLTLFEREPLAKRVVELYPKECWQVQPAVYEEEEADTITPFEEGWDNLGRMLRGEQSWYGEEADNPVWSYLQRLDEVSGLGRYGILLLGIDDGLDLSEPVEGVEQPLAEGQNEGSEPSRGSGQGTDRQYYDYWTSSLTSGNGNDGPSAEQGDKEGKDKTKGSKRRKLTYLRVFPEYLATINSFETGNNPRFGQPTSYQIAFNDPRASLGSGATPPQRTRVVHWTRVIHVADSHHMAPYNEFQARPRMLPVFNPLVDIRKIRGSGAEGYWQSCFSALVYETHPQLGGEVDINPEKLRDAAEEFFGGLKRWLAGVGGSWKTLPPQVIDPTGHIMVPLQAICVALACPQRIFMGSERGELASSQDDAAWNDRVKMRQRTYITSKIVIPFVDRLIAMGVLPKPANPRQVTQPKPKIKLAAPAAGGPPGGGPPMGGKPGGTPPGAPKPPGGAPLFGGKPKAPAMNKAWLVANAPFGKPPLDAGEEEQDAQVQGSDTPQEGQGDDTLDEGQVTPGAEAGAEDGVEGAEGAEFDAMMGQAGSPEEQDPAAGGVTKTLGGYRVEWPDVNSMSPAEKAAVFQQRVAAYGAYLQGGVNQLIPPMAAMTELDGMTEDRAHAMLMDAEADQLEQEATDALAAEEQAALAPQPMQLDAEGKPIPPPPGQGPPGTPLAGGPPQPPPQPGQPKPPGNVPPQFGKKPPVGNANPEGCNQHTGPGCSTGGVFDHIKGNTTVSAVAKRLGLSWQDTDKLVREAVKQGLVKRLNDGTISPVQQTRPIVARPSGVVEQGKTYSLDDKYQAKVVSVNTPSASVGGEKATTIHYLDKKTGHEVGSVVLMKDGDAWILGSHEINEEHRGQGLGRKLLPQLVKQLGKIQSDAGNTEAAKKMWRSIGGRELPGDVFEVTANRSLTDILDPLANAEGCGTGAGGFASGNDCAKDGEGGDLEEAEGRAELASKEKAAQDASKAKEGESPEDRLERMKSGSLKSVGEVAEETLRETGEGLKEVAGLAGKIAGAPVELAKAYLKEVQIRLVEDKLGKAYRALGPDQYEDAKGIVQGIFSRTTLGLGPLGVKAIGYGIKYGPPAFKMMVKAGQGLGRATGWAAKKLSKGIRQTAADATGGYSASGTPLAPAVNYAEISLEELLTRNAFPREDDDETTEQAGPPNPQAPGKGGKAPAGTVPAAAGPDAAPGADAGGEDDPGLQAAGAVDDGAEGAGVPDDDGAADGVAGTSSEPVAQSLAMLGRALDRLAADPQEAKDFLKVAQRVARILAADEGDVDLDPEPPDEEDPNDPQGGTDGEAQGRDADAEGTPEEAEAPDDGLDGQAEQPGQAQLGAAPAEEGLAHVPLEQQVENELAVNSNPEGCNQYTGPGCGLSVKITTVKSDRAGRGGNVVWVYDKDAKEHRITDEIVIRDDGTLTEDQIKGIIEHEKVHIRQARSGRLTVRRNEFKNNALYWDGKEVIENKELRKLINRIKNTRSSPAARRRALEEYKALPWEAEAFATSSPDLSDPVINAWVTLDGGQRVFIGGKGGDQLKPGGPDGKAVETFTSGKGKGGGKKNPFESRSGQGKKPLHPSPSPAEAKPTTPFESGKKAEPSHPKTQAIHKTVKEGPPPTAKHAPADAKPEDPYSPYWRDQAPEEAQGFYSAVKSKMAEWGEDFYRSLTNSPNDPDAAGLGQVLGKGAQRLIDGAMWIDRQLGRGYDAGQRLAHAVAKERGYSDETANRAARMLSVADSVGRFGANWKVPETFGAALGGPVGLGIAGVGAKLSFYVPAASLAFVGYQMGRHALAGKNPFTMIARARRNAKAWKARGKRPTGNASTTAHTSLKSWAEAVMEWMEQVRDADEAEACLAAALDETRGDKTKALEMAKAICEKDEPTDNAGDNCGIGGEGFESGNDCAAGGGGGGGTGSVSISDGPLKGASLTQLGKKSHVHVAEKGGKKYVVKQSRGRDADLDNEVTVSKMAKVAGVNVPEAQLTKAGGKTAVATDMVPGETLVTSDFKAIPKDQVERQLAFDLLTGARDRHERQYLFDGKTLSAIDNELTFTPQGKGMGDAVRDNALYRNLGPGHRPDKGILKDMAGKAKAVAELAPKSARADILHRGKLLEQAADGSMSLNQLAVHMSKARGLFG